MKVKSPYRFILGALIGLPILLFAFGCFMMLKPLTQASDHALTYQEYRVLFPETSVPESASNIWYAMSSVGMGGRASILKFEAPLADCAAYAKREFHGYVKQLCDNPANYPSDELVPFVEACEDRRPLLMDAYGLKNLDWFDCHEVTNGLTIARSGSHLPELRIDVERSTLYSYWTD